ncbi:major facilitator superfamily domain-containing protein [Podospora australis]|uniref:Major facilitator superfamily domain-containing protein n=1 Tax=Podospora australis TaxID=1536484 RepID=A0AAN6WNQ9_9PEZI|nr:major facilitator superfamily domain-containing protein [Podospora australis]
MASTLADPYVEAAEPLLGPDEHDDSQFPTPEDGDGLADNTKRRLRITTQFQVQNPATIILLLSVLMLLITTSGMMYMIPIFRLVEDAFCHVYYDKDPSEPIDERLCKTDAVQGRLAFLGGVGAMMNSFVGVVSALPYGILADRIGRKPSFILAYVGIVVGFGWAPLLLAIGATPSIPLVVSGSLFFLIGGGVPVAMNCLNAMASDISSESDRSTGFLYLSFGAVSGTLVGPFLAGILMEKVSPWFPIFLVFAITPFVFGILVFLPETLPIKLKQATQEDAQPILTKIREAGKELMISLNLLRNTNILLSMAVFFLQPILFHASSSTMVQYVSKYFGWTLAQTSYLLSPPLSILHLLIIVALPRIAKIFTDPTGRFLLSIFSKDILLTKISLLFLLAGALLEGFSQEIVMFLIGLVVSTLGSATSPLGRAVVTAYVDPQQTSRLYGLISLLDTFGLSIGGPTLAWSFNIGLSRKGLWRGLPWFVVASFIMAALIALLFVTNPEKPSDTASSEEEDSSGLGYQSASEET